MLPFLMILLSPALSSQEAAPEIGSRNRLGLTVDAEYWRAGLRGSTRQDSVPLLGPSAPGRSLDFSDDLGLSPHSIVIYGLQYSWPVEPFEATLRFQYWRGAWNGRGIFSRDTLFDHTTFAAGSPLESSFRFDAYEVTLTAGRDLDTEGLFRAFFGAGLRVLYGCTWVSDGVELDRNGEGDLQSGFEFGAQIQPLAFARGELSLGVQAGILGSLSIEATARVELHGGPARLEAGYRLMMYDHSSTDHVLRFILGGFFVGVAADF